MLKTYKTYNLKMKILKYEFNNKLLSDIILFKVILVVTWVQPFFLILKISIMMTSYAICKQWQNHAQNH